MSVTDKNNPDKSITKMTWVRGDKVKRKGQNLTDKESVIKNVKHLLRKTLYEDSDFSVTDKYISVDMIYDSKDYVKFYQEQIKETYPLNTRVSGTRVYIYFGDSHEQKTG